MYPWLQSINTLRKFSESGSIIFCTFCITATIYVILGAHSLGVKSKFIQTGGGIMTNIKKVETNDAPGAVGPYSQATEIDKFIFVSGQLPVDPSAGNLVEANIKAQTARVIDNIQAVLRAAGSDLNQVVRCDVFLKDMNDFKDMNEVYASKFVAEPKPARQAVQVGRLPLDAMVEISCIALKR
jgi:2-iminobutanoate/2-iminopropanoate deaminase